MKRLTFSNGCSFAFKFHAYLSGFQFMAAQKTASDREFEKEFGRWHASFLSIIKGFWQGA